MSSDQTQQRRLQKLRIEAGAEVLQALEEPNVVEVMLNPDGRLWVEACGQGMVEIGRMTPLNAEALIRTVADSLGIVATRETPIVEGEFPLDGSRFEGLLPPVVSGPAFTLRKRPRTIFTLSEYVRQGVMDRQQQERIACAISAYENILIVGGTGSGKTTLTNAVIDGIAALLALVGAGMQLAIPSSSDDDENEDPAEALQVESARQWGALGREVARKNLTIQPTLEIQPGYRFNVLVDQDLILPPYSG